MFAGIMLIRCMGVHFGIFLFYFGEACAHEATSAADFLANWTYTDQVSRCLLCSQDLPSSLSNILHLDAQAVHHVRC